MRRHGTVSTYNTGCRCDLCRAAKAPYIRRSRLGTSRPDLLMSRCWCDAHYVEVPQADVARGVTRSCGLPVCNEASMLERARVASAARLAARRAS